jgi:AcrR family transcriptional regulator
MTAKAETPTRSPGRPRDVRADRAILDAALDSFIEDGYEGMSIESIAGRAGVAKTTIYRRWPSKKELVIGAIDTLFEEFPSNDTGDVQEDLTALVRKAHRFVSETKGGEALPRMFGEIAFSTALGRAYFERIMKPRRDALAKTLEAAKERGDLRADVDVDLAIASIIGSMMFLRVTRALSDQKGDLADRLVAQLMSGLAP